MSDNESRRRIRKELKRETESLRKDIKNEIMEQIEESDRKGSLLVRMTIAVAGLGAALALSVELPGWSYWSQWGINPWRFSCWLMGLMLSILYLCLLDYRGFYRTRKTKARITVALVLTASVGFTIFNWWPNASWLLYVSVASSIAALYIGLESIRVKQITEREVKG